MAYFSYVYMNFIVTAVILIFLAGFTAVSWEKRKTVFEYHDTISSFCAGPKGSWENRFLLFFTVTVSYNLMFLHFEEYNSRADSHETIDVILFAIEITVIFLFGTVGVLYTPGNNPRTTNESYESGLFGEINITISSALHSLFAVLFLGVLTMVNVAYSYVIIQRYPLKKWTNILLIWSVLNVLFGISFIVAQIILKWYSFATNASPKPEETNPSEPQSNSVFKDEIEKRLQTIRLTSFLLECIWGTSVIVLDGFCSVRR
eukprot:259651_1